MIVSGYWLRQRQGLKLNLEGNTENKDKKE
jgi:hypothetical protein